MYCPQCHAEYDDGFTECPDCHIPLLSGTYPAHPLDQATRLSHPVIVLETSDGIKVAMAKGLLEDAGIPLLVDGQIATLVQDVDGFLHKRIRLQVPSDREAEARELLEQLFQPVAENPGDPV